MARYLPLLGQLDAWQAEAQAAHPGIIPCRGGCSACCHGPFDISIADADTVATAIAALPEEIRRPIVVRATAQLEHMRELAPALESPWDVSILGDEAFDELCDALADEPCPALDATGQCVIYESRPLVCRIMGLGLQSTAGGEIPNACPIQDDFPAYAALPAQRFDLPTWEEGEAAALTQAASDRLGDPTRTRFETTIAGAVLLGAPVP
jgi:Fe-S-cluster containining protein